MAHIFYPDDTAIAKCAEQIRRGGLVGMPTETVYGLAGNAFDDVACRKIFAIKSRPLTDPLICHVACLEDVGKMWEGSEDPEIISVALTLGAKFWPGPLSIVAKASPSVAHTATGGSGYVGVRIPRHPVALRLLTEAGVPVAAPSANIFGHVSPTSAQHTFDDLAICDPTLLILDGGVCSVGIESTVIKFNSKTSIEVLRRGQITVCDLTRTLAKIQEELSSKGVKHQPISVAVRDTRKRFEDKNMPMDGPGQLLLHYSPVLPSFLLTGEQVASLVAEVAKRARKSEDKVAGGGDGLNNNNNTHINLLIDGKNRIPLVNYGEEISLLSSSSPSCPIVLIDFDALLEPLAKALSIPSSYYFNLSTTGNAEEASLNVFHFLRSAEVIPGAKVILFPFFSEFNLLVDGNNMSNKTALNGKNVEEEEKSKKESKDVENDDGSNSIVNNEKTSRDYHNSDNINNNKINARVAHEILAAIEDKLFRAAGGRVVTIEYI